MRYNITKENSTKAERIFYEQLKKLKIPFKYRWLIKGREIDFVVGEYAIEIDGHKQDSKKNIELVEAGYTPIHFNNEEVINNRNNIKLWLEQIFQ